MISTQLTKQLQYYVGKLCTVITVPMGLSLTETTHSQWFTVKVDAIDSESIHGTDTQRGTKATYFFPIIGIAEEQVITANDPHYEKTKKDIEKIIVNQPVMPKPHIPAMKSNDFISIDKLKEQVAK